MSAMLKTRPPARRSFPSLLVVSCPWRSVRPALVDTRFKGDAWIESREGGRACLCLGDYQMLRISLSPLDLPSFNHLLEKVRHASRRCRGRRS